MCVCICIMWDISPRNLKVNSKSSCYFVLFYFLYAILSWFINCRQCENSKHSSFNGSSSICFAYINWTIWNSVIILIYRWRKGDMLNFSSFAKFAFPMCIKNFVVVHHSVLSNSLWSHGLQHSRFPCLSPSPSDCSNSSIESVMPSNHLILCCPLILLPLIFPSIKVFSKASVLCIRWPKYWSFSLSISFSNEYSASTVELGFQQRRPILENCVLY